MSTTRPAQIIVVRQLDGGIYASEGGGQAVVWTRHSGGPRAIRKAVRAHGQERREAREGYGNIGMGAGWIEVVPFGGEPGDGIDLADPIFGLSEEELPTPPTGGAPLSWWKEALAHD